MTTVAKKVNYGEFPNVMVVTRRLGEAVKLEMADGGVLEITIDDIQIMDDGRAGVSVAISLTDHVFAGGRGDHPNVVMMRKDK